MDKQTKFEKIILDGDTPLFRAAKSVEEDYVIVTSKADGTQREFKTLTEFYGHHSKKSGGQLEIDNLSNGTMLTHEDFEYEQLVRLKPSIKAGKHLEKALESFHKFIGTLEKTGYADELEIAIGGSKCHRHGLANVLKYKGERAEKPLLFQEVREAIVDQYPVAIRICDGLEADDYLSIKGYESFLEYKKTGVWKYLLAFIDKDILMAISPSIDFYNLNKGIYYQTPAGGATCFASQLLSGDKSTDNILGLPNFTDEIREKYGLRKAKGIGKATALKLIEGCDTKEQFRRVAEAYKSYYGDSDKFTSWRGEELTYSWLDHLQETAYLIWMQRSEGDLIDMEEFLSKMGVSL